MPQTSDNDFYLLTVSKKKKKPSNSVIRNGLLCPGSHVELWSTWDLRSASTLVVVSNTHLTAALEFTIMSFFKVESAVSF